MTTMQMTAVQSSQILAVGYDPATQDLAVEFPKSGVYTYHGVPDHVHAELMAAESVGKAFAALIKPTYTSTRPDGTICPPAVPKAAKAPEPAQLPLEVPAAPTAAPAPTAKATNALAPTDEPYTHDQLVTDLQAAGVLLAKYTPTEIVGLKGLEWLGDALFDCSEELAMLNAEHARKVAPILKRQEALRRYFEPQARKVAEETIEAMGGARKSIDTHLGDGRKFRWSLTTQPARLEVADQAAAINWAKTHLPAAVVAVPERVIPATEALASNAVAEFWKGTWDGNADSVPAGFSVIPETQRFSYKPIGKEG